MKWFSCTIGSIWVFSQRKLTLRECRSFITSMFYNFSISSALICQRLCVQLIGTAQTINCCLALSLCAFAVLPSVDRNDVVVVWRRCGYNLIHKWKGKPGPSIVFNHTLVWLERKNVPGVPCSPLAIFSQPFFIFNLSFVGWDTLQHFSRPFFSSSTLLHCWLYS